MKVAFDQIGDLETVVNNAFVQLHVIGIVVAYVHGRQYDPAFPGLRLFGQ